MGLRPHSLGVEQVKKPSRAYHTGLLGPQVATANYSDRSAPVLRTLTGMNINSTDLVGEIAKST